MTAGRATGRPTGAATAALAVAATTAALILGFLVRPVAGPLPPDQAGDAALAERARDVLGPDRPALAAACVSRAGIRTAAVGAQLSDRFEIGSISKGITGLLFADMIRRGEVRPETRVGELLPLDGGVGAITLEQLATHRSGLPVQLLTGRQVVINSASALTAGNPYGRNTARLLHDLRDAELTSPPGTYSNVGFELLGAALAAAAGRPYPELITERILRPAGLTEATVPVSRDQLDPGISSVRRPAAGRPIPGWARRWPRPAACAPTSPEWPP